jgi:hypothetical protein
MRLETVSEQVKVGADICALETRWPTLILVSGRQLSIKAKAACRRRIGFAR